jgi:cell division protein FtsZ
MSLDITMVPEKTHQPRITVIGVGGAGANAVANMIEADLRGVDFVVANTDLQVLESHRAEKRVHLGKALTEGLGAGANPEVGAAAAEESYDEICEAVKGSHMVFITAGMGGGTGTGAVPVVARAAREQGILTVAVVTKPFSFEGSRRMKLAEGGVEELQSVADTVIVIPNQNLFRIATERTSLQDAFKMADEVLYKGVRGVTDLMIVPGYINLDFNDVKTVMSEMGQAMMGTGEAEGERRAIVAAEMAISSPLLDGISMAGAHGVLINITGGDDMTLYEVDEAANRIREEVDPDANIIFGTAFDDGMNGKIRVSVVATGLGEHQVAKKPTKLVTPHREEPAHESGAEVEEFSKAAARKEVDADEFDMDDLEIPAFLRRQAN